MTKIKLEDLTKLFGDVKATWGVNLTIKDKEFLTLLGPSGCGKTTILRLISGLEKPTRGDIYFDDERVTDLEPGERNVAMVFQSYAIYRHMSVFDNIAFPLQIRKVDKGEIKERVKKTAEFLRIETLLDRKPEQISGGQLQRVAIGRAIIRNPRVFLLDEPLANLDARLRVAMRTELKRMHKELGTTTVYVTHDQVEAMSMSERIVALKDGVLQQVAAPSELYTRPANTWVARFIGVFPMNLLECFLEKKGKYYLNGSGFSYPIKEEEANEIKKRGTESKITFGVNPHDLKVYRKKKPKTLEGRIYAVEPTGARAIVTVEIGENLIKVETEKPEFGGKIGNKVFLKPTGKTYMFDKKGKLFLG